MTLTKELLLANCAEVFPITTRVTFLDLSKEEAEMYKRFVEPIYSAVIVPQSEIDKEGILEDSKSKYALRITKLSQNEVAC